MKKILILASASPRRREIHNEAGFEFTVSPSPYEEEIDQNREACELSKELARDREKAEPVAKAHPDKVILSADTLVVLNGHAMGKPVDEEDAKEMIRKLSGRGHEVITGYTVMCASINKEQTTYPQANPWTRAGHTGQGGRACGEGGRGFS